MATRSIGSHQGLPKPRAQVENNVLKKIVDIYWAFAIYFGIFHSTRSSMLGFLLQLNVEQRKALVSVPHTNRMIWIKYPKSLEDTLAKCLQNTVEITGKIVVDNSDLPTDVRFVRQIAKANLSEIMVSEVLPPNLNLRFTNDTAIRVEFDERQQFYWALHDDLNIISSGYTRTELKIEIQDRLTYMWKLFVQNQDEVLTADALELRNRLQETFVEIHK